ncbi:MAG: dihydrodipicolinate synthase family protein, partial [Methanoculleus sp.]|nr:dihydrodipicolinate synthase family protein [Methanoculleus sp.]
MRKFDKVRRQEHELIRNHVGIQDFTMGLIEITGLDARKMLDEMCVNNIGGLAAGKVMYTSILNEEAIMIDDVPVYCFNEDKFWMITAFCDSTLQWLENHKNGKAVRFENMSDRIALWTIQGPDSRRMLASYMRYDMTNMKYYTFMKNEAGGIPIILSRTGFTGELGFEIFADKTRIEQIVSDLLRVGKKYGVKILETDVTFESIPIEKGLILVRDFGGTNPLEMGMGWSIKWDKPFFVGKERLMEIRNKGVKRKLMGFVALDDEVDIEKESEVQMKGKTIGKVTTANYGYTVEKSIGYCLIDAKHSEIGQTITIVTNGVKVEATLCDRVFYDKERVRVNAEMRTPLLPDQNTKEYLKGSKEKEFKGVYAAMATPFLRDESLDRDALRKLVDHLIEEGVHGILVGGSSGEYPMQSVEERKELFKAAVDAAQGRCKIAACCSTNTTAGTKKLC